VKQSIAARLLRSIVARRGWIAAPLSHRWQRELRTIRETRSKTRLLLDDPAALHIMACARSVRTLGGVMAEAGVFMGGSARLICEERGGAALHLFDVFETLQGDELRQAPEVRGHFGKVHGSLAGVRQLLAPYANVHFHTGLFPQTSRGLEGLKFSFVHLDMDLPGSTRAALEFFHPRMISGGILIGDDYADPELRRCFEVYFSQQPERIIELPWSQAMIVKLAN